jgi:hypothetical protein
MPTITTFVIYADATGEIVRAYTSPDTRVPTPPAGESFLDVGQMAPVPNAKTHIVDLGPPATLVAKSNDDMVSEAKAARIAQIEEALGLLDAVREKMAHPTRGFDTTDIDAQITALETERTDLLTP